MKRGVPPTPLKARTGLFTPPGKRSLAFANSFSDRSVFMVLSLGACVTVSNAAARSPGVRRPRLLAPLADRLDVGPDRVRVRVDGQRVPVQLERALEAAGLRVDEGLSLERARHQLRARLAVDERLERGQRRVVALLERPRLGGEELRLVGERVRRPLLAQDARLGAGLSTVPEVEVGARHLELVARRLWRVGGGDVGVLRDGGERVAEALAVDVADWIARASRASLPPG